MCGCFHNCPVTCDCSCHTGALAVRRRIADVETCDTCRGSGSLDVVSVVRGYAYPTSAPCGRCRGRGQIEVSQ